MTPQPQLDPPQLDQLQARLSQLRAGLLPVHDFCRDARAAQALLAALPPRYAEVLHGLLDRLESSALFTEESCSFSASELHASLQTWVDKARAQLPASSAA